MPPYSVTDCEWLEVFTCQNTGFFQPCERCAGSGRDSSVNFFCIDCNDPAGFCSKCACHHAGHRVLQIRRSSYHDVVRVQDLSQVTDISGIQTYMINSSKVMFLKQRPQPRPSNTTLACVCCRRQLQDASKYCSLRCKLESVGLLDSEGELAPLPKGTRKPAPKVAIPSTPSNSEGDYTVVSGSFGDWAMSKRTRNTRWTCSRRKRMKPCRSPLQ